jgi:hypothetical protein
MARRQEKTNTGSGREDSAGGTGEWGGSADSSVKKIKQGYEKFLLFFSSLYFFFH